MPIAHPRTAAAKKARNKPNRAREKRNGTRNRRRELSKYRKMMREAQAHVDVVAIVRLRRLNQLAIRAHVANRRLVEQKAKRLREELNSPLARARAQHAVGAAPSPKQEHSPSTMQDYLAHPSDLSKGHTVIVDGRRLTMANLGMAQFDHAQFVQG